MIKKKIAFAGAVLMLVLALGIMAYPVISTAYNNAHRSEILTQHMQEMETVPDQRIVEMRKNAEAYNQMLNPITQEKYTSQMFEEAADDYANQLDLSSGR